MPDALTEYHEKKRDVVRWPKNSSPLLPLIVDIDRESW